MAELQTAREKSRTLNTLAVLVKGLVGHVTTVELRNEASVFGRIMEVDSAMNMTMRAAIFRSPKLGNERMRCDQFYIQGKNIRFIHIPDTINMMETIEQQITLRTGRKQNSGRPERQERKTKEEVKREQKLKKKEKLEKRLEEMKYNLGLLTGENVVDSADRTTELSASCRRR